MDKDKNIPKQTPITVIETIFWFLTIFVAIFINISSRALHSINIFLAMFLFVAFLVIILSRILPHLFSLDKKTVFLVATALIIAIAFLLIGIQSFRSLATFYYLPASIAIAMALLVIIEPGSPVIILVSVCTFILGEAFWNIQIMPQQRLKFPIAFFRIFSLTVIALFAYYSYRKEMVARRELNLLNERLKALDNKKSEFLANVSHELRTPLTSIRNAITLLKGKIEAQEKKISISEDELLEIVTSNINRQSKLINALLDLSKIEKDELFSSRSFVNIGLIAREALKSLAMQASEKNIEITSDIQKNLPKIYAAEDQIAQVYTNLLDNAIKYTDRNGKVFLQIKLSPDGIESVVEDSGIGISPEDLDKIFDKFVRLKVTLEHENKGVGLGLVITKGIIESHGGRIWVESKIGRGSKFNFVLPKGLRKIDQKQEKG